jgi:hypothetical protein
VVSKRSKAPRKPITRQLEKNEQKNESREGILWAGVVRQSAKGSPAAQTSGDKGIGSGSAPVPRVLVVSMRDGIQRVRLYAESCGTESGHLSGIEMCPAYGLSALVRSTGESIEHETVAPNATPGPATYHTTAAAKTML